MENSAYENYGSDDRQDDWKFVRIVNSHVWGSRREGAVKGRCCLIRFKGTLSTCMYVLCSALALARPPLHYNHASYHHHSLLNSSTSARRTSVADRASRNADQTSRTKQIVLFMPSLVSCHSARHSFSHAFLRDQSRYSGYFQRLLTLPATPTRSTSLDTRS
jgi:hypothetical protein